jgi:hypothetical protein
MVLTSGQRNGHHALDLEGMSRSELTERFVGERLTNLELEERLWELELALEDEGWTRGDRQGELEFSREAMERIIGRCRLFFLQNPVINHAVQVQQDYVFAQGVNITGQGVANDVTQKFLDDPANVRSFTGAMARIEDEKRLLTEGNIFLALFTNPFHGRVVVRHIPVEQVLAGEIITNPDDAEEVWFYRRRWSNVIRNASTGEEEREDRDEYYPDWRHRPRVRVLSYGGKKVNWDSPIYHVQVGGIAGSHWGIPELYSALAWARAVTTDLTDYASMRRAASRYAHSLTVKGGAPAVSSAKAQLESSLGMNPVASDSNPPPTTGSTWVQAEGAANLQAAPLVHVQSADDGRRLGLMVAAGVGIPETMLFGDADVGNLATASTLDRPTELKFAGRQTLWAGVYEDIVRYVIMASARAPKGLVKTTNALVLWDEELETEVLIPKNDPTNEKDGPNKGKFDPEVEITFPAILQQDVQELVTAIVTAATLDSKTPVDILPMKLLRRLLMEAIGVDDVDKALEEMDEEDLNQQAEDILNPPPIPPGQPGGPPMPPQDPNAPPQNDPAGGGPQPTGGSPFGESVEMRTLRGLRAFREALEGPLELEEHPGHNQKSHGNWATGGTSASPFGAGGPPKRKPARDTATLHAGSADRAKMHADMLERRMQGVPSSSSPTVYMTGGGPASGKTAAVIANKAAGIPPGNRAAHMDPDSMKTEFPEYGAAKAAGRKWASSHVHEESSSLAKSGVHEGLRRGHDVVYDTVGDSGYPKLASKVAGFRAAGAKKVVARYATVDTKTAISRSDARALSTGRSVPHSVIRGGHADVSRTFVEALRHDLFDDVKLFDTGGSKGAPRLVVSKTKGQKVQVHDQNLWNAFVAKGGEA